MPAVFPPPSRSSGSRSWRAAGWRRRLSLATVLLAWLLATGSHWDLVQTFAWGRMIANYSQSMPVMQAVRLTFTADNLCGVCETVSVAKQQQDASEGTVPSDGKLLGKILLVFQPVSRFVLMLPAGGRWSAKDLTPREVDSAPPPVPPPRALV